MSDKTEQEQFEDLLSGLRGGAIVALILFLMVGSMGLGSLIHAEPGDPRIMDYQFGLLLDLFAILLIVFFLIISFTGDKKEER